VESEGPFITPPIYDVKSAGIFQNERETVRDNGREGSFFFLLRALRTDETMAEFELTEGTYNM
jgi:hypothetical protein